MRGAALACHFTCQTIKRSFTDDSQSWKTGRIILPSSATSNLIAELNLHFQTRVVRICFYFSGQNSRGKTPLVKNIAGLFVASSLIIGLNDEETEHRWRYFTVHLLQTAASRRFGRRKLWCGAGKSKRPYSTFGLGGLRRYSICMSHTQTSSKSFHLMVEYSCDIIARSCVNTRKWGIAIPMGVRRSSSLWPKIGKSLYWSFRFLSNLSL